MNGEDGAPRCRILVAGVGGGACHMLDHALKGWEGAPAVAAVNSDLRALEEISIPLKVAIGRTVAKGMGAGGNAELGQLAASEDPDRLRALLSGYDMLIMVACLGGGTGTGAAPVLARMAQDANLLTLAYVTTPFDFEGPRRQEQAAEGLATLKMCADAVVCLPNQRLYSLLEPETPLTEAFAFVDRMMAAGIRGLWTLLARDNMLNLDFSDVQSLVENSGNECCLGYGEGEGPDRTATALASLLEGPILEKGRVIANSGAMILSVTGGPDLALSELETIHRRFQEAARGGARIVMGAAVLPEWTGKLTLSVLVAEHWMPVARKGESAGAQGGLLLFDEMENGEEPVTLSSRRRRKSSGTFASSAEGAKDSGRFRDVSPTIHGGEDLDIPTYRRRGVKMSS